MSLAYLLTGSNMGDPVLNLHKASVAVGEKIGNVVRASAVYRTEPWGNKNQQSFYNQVLLVETKQSPRQLMATILGIEHGMGRNRQQKWEPRIIDIDILFYDAETLHEHDLVIPHPLLHERRFTLVPLAEIVPQLVHPVLKQTIAQLLASCTDTGTVEKL